MGPRHALYLIILLPALVFGSPVAPTYVSTSPQPTAGGACTGSAIWFESATGKMWCCGASVLNQWGQCGAVSSALTANNAVNADHATSAGVATVLSTNGINCSTGQAAQGVDNSGNAEGCWTPAAGTGATGVIQTHAGSGQLGQYAGTSCLTSFPRSLDGLGAATCAKVSTSDMATQGTTTTVLHGNASGAPSYGAVALGTDVSGTLPVTNGGLGAVTWAADTHPVGTGAGTLAMTTIPACSNATTSKLLYDTTTHTFACGTDQTSTGVSAPAGSDKQIQYNAAGTMAGAANANIDSGGYLNVPATSTYPTASGAGSGPTLSATSTGRLAATSTLSGSAGKIFGFSAFERDFIWVVPSKVTGGATVPITLGSSTAATNVGTISNPVGKFPYWQLTGAAANPSTVETYVTTSVLRSDASFLFAAVFGYPTNVTSRRSIIGWWNSNAATSTGSNPSTWGTSYNGVWAGNDSTETTLRICSGASGTTCTTCGANFPTNSTTAIYQFVVAGSAGYGWRAVLKRLDTAVADCTFTPNTTVPASGLTLYGHAYANQNSSTTAATLAIYNMTMETYY